MRTAVRSGFILVLLCSVSACGSADKRDDATVGVVTQAAGPDESTAIGQKWVKLGGKPVVGDKTSEVITAPGGVAQYQLFTNGAIVYTDDFGPFTSRR